MRFTVEHETSTYMRLRLLMGHFSQAEAEILRYAMGKMKGVSGIRLYPSSGGIAFFCQKDPASHQRILKKLRALHFKNVEMFARKIDNTIHLEELELRKLSPEIRKGLRRKVLLETAADLFLPTPIQVGYHVYQLVTLKDL